MRIGNGASAFAYIGIQRRLKVLESTRSDCGLPTKEFSGDGHYGGVPERGLSGGFSGLRP